MKKLLTYCVCLVVITVSCSKEQPTEITTAEGVTINLTATEDSPTKALTPIPTGTEVSIWVYKRTSPTVPASLETPLVSAKNYDVLTNGTLSPANGAPLYLTKGDYDIYTFGQIDPKTFNSSQKEVVNGVTGNLVYGNYIFASSTVSVSAMASATSQTINLAYDHISMNLNLSLTKATSIETLTVSKISIGGISMSKPLDFSTGKIENVTVLNSTDLDSETYLGGLYNAIMCPCVSGVTFNYTITATVKPYGLAAEEKIYKMKFTPLVNLEGGKSYTIHAEISATGITFKNATVNDWNSTGPGTDIESDQTT